METSTVVQTVTATAQSTFSHDVLYYLSMIYFTIQFFVIFWCFKQIVLFLWTIFKDYIFLD